MSSKTYYANESDIPENLKGAYVARNSRYELAKLEADHPSIVALDEIKLKHDTLKTQNGELLEAQTRLESKLLPDGQVAVDKTEYETLKTENEGYKALGELSEIKPKVEGYDELRTTTKQAVKDKALMAAGITEVDRARKYKSYDELDIESEIKDGKEIFYRVVKDEKGKESKVVFDSEVLKSDLFKDDLGSLLSGSGTKMFRQATGGVSSGNLAKVERIKAEVKQKEEARGNAGKSFVEAFSGTNPG